MEEKQPNMRDSSSGENDQPEAQNQVTLKNSTPNVTGRLPRDTETEGDQSKAPVKVRIPRGGKLSIEEGVLDFSVKEDVFVGNEEKEKDMEMVEDEGVILIPQIQSTQPQPINQNLNQQPRHEHEKEGRGERE